MDQLRGSASAARSLHRENSTTTERRSTRTTVTTREKAQVKTRNVIREPSNVGNRGEVEKSRSKAAGDVEGHYLKKREKDKDVAEGMSSLVNV